MIRRRFHGTGRAGYLTLRGPGVLRGAGSAENLLVPYVRRRIVRSALARQRRRGRRFDVPLPCRVGDTFERIRHPYQLAVVPRPSQQLHVDRLAAIVVADWEGDAWNAIRRARRVAAAETRLAAAAVV